MDVRIHEQANACCKRSGVFLDIHMRKKIYTKVTTEQEENGGLNALLLMIRDTENMLC